VIAAINEALSEVHPGSVPVPSDGTAVINVKTAKALGLDSAIPAAACGRGDPVIERCRLFAALASLGAVAG
jgi:hypothetical protein